MASTAVASFEKLTPPGERPMADVVIYDGHCRICTSQVARLARWDTQHRLAFLSLHDAEVARRYPDLSHDYLMTNMVVVDPQGNKFAGADAFRRLSKRLPRLWWLAVIMHLPLTMPLWRWLYKIVAKRRYLIAGKTACAEGTCAVHFGPSKK